MLRFRLVTGLLLLALPAAAQSVDMAVSIAAGAREPRLVANYGIHVNWDAAEGPANAVLTVDAPAPIARVSEWDAAMLCTYETMRVRCTLPGVARFDGGLYLQTAPATPGTFSATATVTSTTPDPNPENNGASRSIEVTGLPLLSPGGFPEIDSGDAVDPARPATLRAGVENHGETATDVVMRVTLPEGGSFTAVVPGADMTCTVAPQEVVCRAPKLEWLESHQFRIAYLPPDRDDGGTFPVRFTAEAKEPNHEPSEGVSVLNVPMRRRFHVTNAAGDGDGSLRQAILDANANCAETLCLIAIRAPEPIRPRTPLPEVAGFVKIDGGDARAELDGSLLEAGHGLSGDVCELRVENLRIHDFPGHAVDARQGSGCTSALRRLYVRGSDLRHNLRGVVAKTLYVEIAENDIVENDRAGIFIDGSFSAVVRDNRIVGNRASGVFVNLQRWAPYTGWPPAAVIRSNVIRDNLEWGVCRTPNGYVQVTENSIARNFLYALDVGLDLGTPNRPDDSLSVPNKPVLLSATYDPGRNQTVVRVRSENAPAYGSPRIDLYVSDSLSAGGYPDAERRVQTAFMPVRGVEFEVAIEGDHRGKWIAAATTLTVTFDWEWIPSNTSELSDAVQVQ